MKKTPYYEFSKETFIKNIKSFNFAFLSLFNEFQVAYSVKTNKNPYICKTALKNGCFAEVASPYEFMLARKIGFPYSRIIYNGVCKDVKQSYKLASHGGIVFLDSLNEYFKLSEYAKKKGKRISVGARIAIDVGNNFTSHFGFGFMNDDVQPFEFSKFTKLVSKDKYVSFNGLLCHTSNARDLEFWKTKANYLAFLCNQFNLDYIDFGSNMYSDMEESLSVQYGSSIPSFNDYARVIKNEFDEMKVDKNVKIFIEPGTPLVANAVDYYSTVVDIKRIGGKDFVVFDGSKFDMGWIANAKNVPIVVHRKEKGKYIDVVDATFVGSSCVEIDIMNKGYTGKIAIGDVVQFKNVGAYSVSVAPDFITPTKKMYCGDKTIKKQSTFRKMFF